MKVTLNIDGMHCASCAATITKNLEKKEGVKKVNVNFVSKKAEIRYDEKLIKEKKIVETIIDSGFSVIQKNNDHSEKDKLYEKSLFRKTFLSIILTLPIFIRMFWAWEINTSFLGISFSEWTQIVLAFFIVFVLGYDFHRNAIKQAKKIPIKYSPILFIFCVSKPLPAHPKAPDNKAYD